MSKRFDRGRFWRWAALVLAVEAVAALLWLHRADLFGAPTDAVYDRYAGREGYSVACTHGYKLGDGVAVDVTLVRAEDSASWVTLQQEMGIPRLDLLPAEVRALMEGRSAFGYRLENDDVVTYARRSRTVCVFHAPDERQRRAIMDNKLDEIEQQTDTE